MNRPPLMMRVKIQGENANFGLWLPLFLLIPVVLVVLIILSPLILITLPVLWALGWGKPAVMFIPFAWNIYCSMSGLKVDVQNSRESVFVSVV